jgi:AraC family transcriptional regulator, regulatory protein of adaptative response / DNA-3-methyladenine glycosylase II
MRQRAEVFELEFRVPYDWEALLAFLGARAIAGVEEIGGDTYGRAIRLHHARKQHTGWIAISSIADRPSLRVSVTLSLLGAVDRVLEKVRFVMDLDADPDEIAAALGTIAKKHPGLRVPGCFDGFEIAVRAILGQQISVKAARTMAGRFAAAFGTRVSTPFEGVTLLFPRANDVGAQEPERVAELGIVRTRARTIVTLAQAIARGELRLDPGADVESTLVTLRSIPGIGEWTAQYIAMRALAWRDAFPHSDLGLMKALQERNPRRVLAKAEAWRPWRAYALMHLWHTLR